LIVTEEKSRATGQRFLGDFSMLPLEVDTVHPKVTTVNQVDNLGLAPGVFNLKQLK